MKLMLATAAVMTLSGTVQAETVKTPEQIVRDHVANANKGDVDAVMADYADDAVTVMADRTMVGKAAIREGFVKLAGMKLIVTPVEIKEIGNVGYIKYTTNLGISGSESFVIRHGKIIADAAFFDAPPAAH